MSSRMRKRAIVLPVRGYYDFREALTGMNIRYKDIDWFYSELVRYLCNFTDVNYMSVESLILELIERSTIRFPYTEKDFFRIAKDLANEVIIAFNEIRDYQANYSVIGMADDFMFLCEESV